MKTTVNNSSSCIYLEMVWIDIDDYDSNLEQELLLTCNNPESMDYHSENIYIKNCTDVNCPYFKPKVVLDARK